MDRGESTATAYGEIRPTLDLHLSCPVGQPVLKVPDLARPNGDGECRFFVPFHLAQAVRGDPGERHADGVVGTLRARYQLRIVFRLCAHGVLPKGAPTDILALAQPTAIALGEQKTGINLDEARQAHEHSLDIGFNVSATSVVLH